MKPWQAYWPIQYYPLSALISPLSVQDDGSWSDPRLSIDSECRSIKGFSNSIAKVLGKLFDWNASRSKIVRVWWRRHIVTYCFAIMYRSTKTILAPQAWCAVITLPKIDGAHRLSSLRSDLVIFSTLEFFSSWLFLSRDARRICRELPALGLAVRNSSKRLEEWLPIS